MADPPGKWERLRGLSAWQWKVLLASPFILLLTWLRLRFAGYVRTLARAKPARESSLVPDEALQMARETAYPLAVAVKYGPWAPKCLVRSLALGWFLGRRDIPFNIRIGIPSGGSAAGADGKLDFSAHAWVEFDGVVLNDREDVAVENKPFEC